GEPGEAARAGAGAPGTRVARRRGDRSASHSAALAGRAAPGLTSSEGGFALLFTTSPRVESVSPAKPAVERSSRHASFSPTGSQEGGTAQPPSPPRASAEILDDFGGSDDEPSVPGGGHHRRWSARRRRGRAQRESRVLLPGLDHDGGGPSLACWGTHGESRRRVRGRGRHVHGSLPRRADPGVAGGRTP